MMRSRVQKRVKLGRQLEGKRKVTRGTQPHVNWKEHEKMRVRNCSTMLPAMPQIEQSKRFSGTTSHVEHTITQQLKLTREE
jgi:hypothetical protein